MFSALKKKLGKKKKKGQTRGGPLPQDHLQANTGFGDDDVKKIKSLTTNTANESIDKVKYNKQIGDSGTKEGFFKGGATWGDPLAEVSSKGNDVAENERHMGLRSVLSSQVDKKLGTDVLTEEHFASHGGREGTVSSMARGEALRDNKGSHYAFAEIDGNDAAYQRSMWDLQLNDYLTGQVDRHAGNIFYDPKSGRVRGIDNDLAFGDQFNETIGTEKGRMSGLKHVRELPHMIDAATADAVMRIDDNEYLDMLLATQGGEQLDAGEALQAYERLQDLKTHIQGIEDGEVEGQIVDEWGEETYAEAMEHGDTVHSSYLKRHQDYAGDSAQHGDNRKLKKRDGVKTFSAEKKRTKKRNKAKKKEEKAIKKATKRQRKAERAANKLDLSASSAVSGGLFDYLDPSI